MPTKRVGMGRWRKGERELLNVRNQYFQYFTWIYYIWDNVFKNRPHKICGRQPLKNLK